MKQHAGIYINTVKHKICTESNTDTIISESSADLFASAVCLWHIDSIVVQNTLLHYRVVVWCLVECAISWPSRGQRKLLKLRWQKTSKCVSEDVWVWDCPQNALIKKHSCSVCPASERHPPPFFLLLSFLQRTDNSPPAGRPACPPNRPWQLPHWASPSLSTALFTVDSLFFICISFRHFARRPPSPPLFTARLAGAAKTLLLLLWLVWWSSFCVLGLSKPLI